MTERDRALLAALERQRAELDVLIAQLRGDDAATRSSAMVQPEDWTTLSRAAELLGRTEETAARIVRQNGLGSVIDGRWRIDRNRVHAFMARRPYTPIPQGAETLGEPGHAGNLGKDRQSSG